MKKWLLISGILLLIIIGVLLYLRFFYAKSFSPESDVNFEADKLKIHINYNRPYKKGRLIFGDQKDGALVPFGKVWRTGANEATVFETNLDLKIKDQTLKAGAYSFWTIPGEQSWTIIFNSEYGQWGIDYNGVANRDPKNDVLTLIVPSAPIKDKEIEQFSISLEKMGEEMEMILLWDKTLVAIPFSL
jgi:hypothetical protein